jgi:hypothetical protein
MVGSEVDTRKRAVNTTGDLAFTARHLAGNDRTRV